MSENAQVDEKVNGKLDGTQKPSAGEGEDIQGGIIFDASESCEQPEELNSIVKVEADVVIVPDVQPPVQQQVMVDFGQLMQMAGTQGKKRGRIWIIVTAFLACALIGVSIFAVMQTSSLIEIREIAQENKLYYEAEVEKNEYLQQTVAKLEDEKKTLQFDNQELQFAKQQLLNEQAVLTSELSNTEGRLSEAQDNLATQADSLEKVTADYNTKRAQLDKANRGLSKFAQLEELYTTFKNKRDQFMASYDNGVSNIIAYLATGSNSALNQANESLKAADAIYMEMEQLNTQMNSIFNQIKSGDY